MRVVVKCDQEQMRRAAQSRIRSEGLISASPAAQSFFAFDLEAVIVDLREGQYKPGPTPDLYRKPDPECPGRGLSGDPLPVPGRAANGSELHFCLLSGGLKNLGQRRRCSLPNGCTSLASGSAQLPFGTAGISLTRFATNP